MTHVSPWLLTLPLAQPMGDKAEKLQRAAKSHVSSIAFGVRLVLVAAWKSDHTCFLLEEGCGFPLGCT